jgi:two-component system response regulator
MSGADLPVRVLVAEDDLDDQEFLRQAFQDCRAAAPAFVKDGAELLALLRAHPPRLPDLVLLDLNMPRLDGRQALREIKGDPILRSIPVVVLTTSQDTADVQRCYQDGANSFFTKPSSYEELRALVRLLTGYWLGGAKLPG